MGDGQARSMAWERVATQQIIRFSTSDVAAQVWQLQEQIDLLLKMSLSLKLWQGKCTRMFIAFAFQWEGLSKHSLFLDSSWCGLLERRSAQLLFKWVCNLETFLGKQVCSEEGYLHAKPEDEGTRSDTPVKNVAGEWLWCALIYEGTQSHHTSFEILMFFNNFWIGLCLFSCATVHR